MNFKLLFPTFRTRYRFVEQQLAELAPDGVPRVLNLGTGEGDYDRMIKRRCDTLCACDINEDDIAFARQLNRDQPGIEYAVQDGQSLSYPSDHFDLVTCIEVVEHVDDPARMVAEIARVLKPGGYAVVTAPSFDFPFTYDPVNALLRGTGRHLGVGAYAYGHTHLVREADLVGWLGDSGLAVLRRHHLSGSLSALAECYWVGGLQRLLKANSTNRTARTRRRFVVKPSLSEPRAAALTDLLIGLDQRLCRRPGCSVGLGVVARKPAAGGPADG